jgi:hypothetical protein
VPIRSIAAPIMTPAMPVEVTMLCALIAVSVAGFRLVFRMARTVRVMWAVVVILLVVWAILSIIGFVFHGLLWLAIIGIVLFVGTLIFGILRQRSRRARA